MPDQAGDAFRDCTTRLLRVHKRLLAQDHHGQSWLSVNIDVSPMDNSGSHKEGVSCTYKKFDGYAPIFTYAGPHGFVLNNHNQLRPGSSHCNCEGTKDWLSQTLKRAEAVAPEGIRRLVVTDAGHEAAKNMLLFTQTPDTDFLVKRNLRRQNLADWPMLGGKTSSRTSLTPGSELGMGSAPRPFLSRPMSKTNRRNSPCGWSGGPQSDLPAPTDNFCSATHHY
ncbi:hypothetical protein SAMN05443144_1343 [Fodinibius roseus]|uniref:Transposase DDE domain group 1 n=2 Tax=Fodinibius roseus TaxID=1194090 RepID=A0A1M5KS19_9BACT|nr:hypothetical protein SAMN05443144_1343 [Fodinibius roseus]